MGINQSFPDEKVHQLLGQLQIEVENFVLKMAAEFPQRKEQLVFLINNYDMMLNVIMVSKHIESNSFITNFNFFYYFFQNYSLFYCLIQTGWTFIQSISTFIQNYINGSSVGRAQNILTV